jgi:hypothetical protein
MNDDDLRRSGLSTPSEVVFLELVYSQTATQGRATRV